MSHVYVCKKHTETAVRLLTERIVPVLCLDQTILHPAGETETQQELSLWVRPAGLASLAYAANLTLKGQNE
jgi:hypothetical protein